MKRYDLTDIDFTSFERALAEISRNLKSADELLDKFVSVIVESDDCGQKLSVRKELLVTDRGHDLVRLRESDFTTKTIWGVAHVVDMLDFQLASILGDVRLGLEMLICRIPCDGTVKFGSLTIAPKDFTTERETDLLSKFDDKSFYFPSSIFLLRNKDHGCAAPVLLYTGDLLTPPKELDINLIRVDGNDFIFNGEDLWLKDQELLDKYRRIINTYCYWTGVGSELGSVFGVLFIPSSYDDKSRVALLCPIRCIDKKQKRQIWSVIKNAILLTKVLGGVLEKYLAYAIEDAAKERLCVANTQSAIAAIMSRNGSHNIGSHVLSALTHNIGTMPDDRVLYQYIQHRMDYIATATTGFPDWGVPTMFVGEIMRNFLTQHHLLDYIVESEGLHAYHFQGHKSRSLTNNKNTLRLKIVARENDEKRQFIDYGNGGCDLGTALNDVCVSVPGGVAGHHAIYTILENVIRNAAKHGWANRDKEKALSNLEVTVEFEDDPKLNRVWVTVYDNAPMSAENAKKLVDSLNVKLKEKLISEDADGALRKENWGLAEMRISAAYLQQRTLEETGGLSELKQPDSIIFAKVIGPDKKGLSYLGYRFFVRKPQEMLLVVPECWSNAIAHLKDHDGKAARIMAHAGIDVAWQNKKDECFDVVTGERIESFRYAYAVLPHQPKRKLLHNGAWPFRLLVLGGRGALVWTPPVVGEDGGHEEAIGSKMLPSLAAHARDIRTWLCQVGEGGGESQGTSADYVDKATARIRKTIYEAWVRYLDKRTRTLEGQDRRGRWLDGGPRKLAICVDTVGDDKNSGRGLMSDRDVGVYLLEHSYGTILDSWRKIIEKESQGIAQVAEREIVIAQISALLDGLCRITLDKKIFDCRNFPDCNAMDQVAEWILSLSDVEKCVKELESKGIHIRESLGNCLVGAFSATDAMLRKYSEQIDTLPKKFCLGVPSGSGRDNADAASVEECLLESVKLIPKDVAKTDAGSAECTISYLRHAGTAPRDIYASGLSGSQSCFSQFARFEVERNVQGKQSMLVRLVENALLRVLIIDERVFKFLSSRPHSIGTLSRMNIWAVDTDMTHVETLECGQATHGTESCLKIDWKAWQNVNQGGHSGVERNACDVELLPSGDFDILVIHQGIIDKVLGEKCSRTQVEGMLERLKKIVPYVVITTGRGRPTNTPASARILPFSCVERYLFQKWPEKFLLVNSIMNLLPCGD